MKDIRIFRPAHKPRTLAAMREYLDNHPGYDRYQFANNVKLNSIDWSLFGLRDYSAPLALLSEWAFDKQWGYGPNPESDVHDLLREFKKTYGHDTYQEGRNGGHYVLDGVDLCVSYADAEDLRYVTNIVYAFDTLCDKLIANIAEYSLGHEYRVIDDEGNIEVRQVGDTEWYPAEAFGWA